jgi:adenylate cyclase
MATTSMAWRLPSAHPGARIEHAGIDACVDCSTGVKGVNIAARLENIAEPGTIRVSAIVRDHVLDKLGFAFDDLGEQSVKNIPRPVRVYRVQLGDGEGKDAVAAAAVAPPQNKRATPAKSPGQAGGGVHFSANESGSAMDSGFRRRGKLILLLGMAALVVIVAAGAWLASKQFQNPSPPLGAERVLAQRAGEVGASAGQQPTSPVLSSLKGGEEKETESARHLSIVVLPFSNLSGDSSQDYFADAARERLYDGLRKAGMPEE